MIRKEFVVTKIPSLTSTDAALFIDCANHYASRILLADERHHANAKSLMSVLAMEIRRGKHLELQAEGEDEGQAVNALLDRLA